MKNINDILLAKPPTSDSTLINDTNTMMTWTSFSLCYSESNGKSKFTIFSLS